jgi:hypothetical protein
MLNKHGNLGKISQNRAINGTKSTESSADCMHFKDMTTPGASAAKFKENLPEAAKRAAPLQDFDRL